MPYIIVRKVNAAVERKMRTIKEKVIWINESPGLEKSKEKVIRWIDIEYKKIEKSISS